VRWVFYSLLVVNLVYLGWQLTMAALAPEPGVVAAPTAAPQGPTLRLLSEVSRPRRDQPAPSETGAPAGLCPVVGPWAGEGAAERARIQLAAAGLEGSIRPVSVQKDHLNWVYLPAYPGRDQALEVLSELQTLGVDSFIVKTGEDANAISLGYFSSAESAEGLRVKMQGAGYPARVRQTSRAVTEYWLYLPAQAAGAAALDDFLIGNPGVGRDRAACNAPQ